MPIAFADSQTKINLMRAFAGESQARNRYTFAAGILKKANQYALSEVFRFTADQEKEHAEIFYKLLAECAGENIRLDAAYPVNVTEEPLKLLRYAKDGEYEEHGSIYPAFAQTAREEGFMAAAHAFSSIAAIEKIHGDRFALFAGLLEEGKLFSVEGEGAFMCLNCGHIHRVTGGGQAPAICPVCAHDQGYFIPTDMAPYTMVPCTGQ